MPVLYTSLLLGLLAFHACCTSVLLTSFPLILSLGSTLSASKLAATPDFEPTQDLTARAASQATPLNGPVIDSNFADPSAIHVDGIWYAFATNNHFQEGPDGQNIQVATSTNFVDWKVTGNDALPVIGAWAFQKAVWAPSVVRRQNGTFVMYYAATAVDHPRKHCIGAATSENVEGPYTPISTSIACPLVQGGAIDPSGFTDIDGKTYVVYKVDGNSLDKGRICVRKLKPSKHFIPRPTPLMLQALASDSVTPLGDPVQLLDREEGDGPLIEAPSLVRSKDGKYILFFSSNCFDTPLYDVAYATSDHVAGPYVRAARPFLKTGMGPGLKGPGGAAVTPDGSKLVFHGILGQATNKLAKLTRGMYTANIEIKDASVILT